MDNISGLCFSCMHPLDEEGKCTHCGATEPPVQEFPLLPLGTLINDRYFIGKALKTNGEGSTYAAYDKKLDKPCTLREFFPSAISCRDADCLTIVPNIGSEGVYAKTYDAFSKLWTKLSRLKGLTALIYVYEVFSANSTFYAVYSDSEEHTLRTFLLSQDEGCISWDQARIMFMPVLSTISTLHTSGIIHLGIDPSSLIIAPDGRLKMTDFCTSNVKTGYGELNADISDGYAPPEVYSENGEIGTWTDVYSFTAVLFRTLVGSTPISSPVRVENDQMMIPAKFAEKLPPHVINALINAMQLDIDDRTHTAEQLRSNLSASPRAIGASASVFAKNTAELNAKSAQQRYNPGANPDLLTSKAPGRQPADMAYLEPLTPDRIEKAKSAEANALKQDKLKKFLKISIGLIIIMIILGLGLIFSDIGDSGTKKPKQEDTPTAAVTAVVPNFTGKMYDAVTSDSYYREVFVFKTDMVNDQSVPRGQIIAQSISADTIVPQGTCIYLTVSKGPLVFNVPDVSGKTYEEALAALSSQQLICSKNLKYNDGTHPSNTVAETVPPAGTQVTAGDEIKIVMWADSGDETEQSSQSTQTADTPTGVSP